MQYKGVLRKMRTEWNFPIQYFLQMETEEVHINTLINQQIQLQFIGHQCLCCGNKRKIYRQGFCYNCFYEEASVGDWVMRPELSKAHLGIEDRNLEFEKEVQLKPHIVYLALSSEVKVGVTRKTQVPDRWIDQGANAALAIVETPNRYLAGITEVALKQHVADKTNWRKMLQNDIPNVNLLEIKNQLMSYIPDEAKSFILSDNTDIVTINFPVEQYPTKLKSLNLEKTPTFTGILKGIKGQYFIFEDNTVLNVRGNEGLVITLSY